MFMLNILLAILGIAFFAFGFAVCFKKKYNLVNLLVLTKSSDKYDDTYAEQIGLIALMSGMLYIFSGIVGFVSANIWVSLILILACTFVMSSFLAVSKIKANRA